MFDSLKNLLKDMLTALFEWAYDAGVYIFEGLLEILTWLVEQLPSIPGGEFFSENIETLHQLSPQGWELLGRGRIPECMGIMLAALLTSLLMRLIPFVRLGR